MLFELILIWLNNSYNYKSRYIKFLSISLLTFTTKSLLRLRTVGAKFEFEFRGLHCFYNKNIENENFRFLERFFPNFRNAGTFVYVDPPCPAAAAAVSGDRWGRAVPLSSQQVSRAKEFYRCSGLFFDTYSVFYTKFTRSLVARSSLRGWGR